MHSKWYSDSLVQSSGDEQAGDTDSEQCLVTKALCEATGTTRLNVRVKNLAVFRLNESSGKALSAKHAYQAYLSDLTVWAHSSFEKVSERAQRLKYAQGLNALSVAITKPIRVQI